MIGGGNKKVHQTFGGNTKRNAKPGGSRLLHSSHPEGGSSSTGGVQSEDDGGDDDGDGGGDDGDGGVGMVLKQVTFQADKDCVDEHREEWRQQLVETVKLVGNEHYIDHLER